MRTRTTCGRHAFCNQRASFANRAVSSSLTLLRRVVFGDGLVSGRRCTTSEPHRTQSIELMQDCEVKQRMGVAIGRSGATLSDVVHEQRGSLLRDLMAAGAGCPLPFE